MVFFALVNGLVAIGTLISQVIRGINFIKKISQKQNKISSSVSAAYLIFLVDKMFTDRKVKTPPSVNLVQFGGCDVVQYLSRRDSLKCLAEQHAKKRPNTSCVNLVLFCFFAILLGISIWILDLFPRFKETIYSSVPFIICYIVWLLFLEVLFFRSFLLSLFNVPSWSDFKEKGRYNFTKLMKDLMKMKKAKEEAAKIKKEAKEEVKKIKKGTKEAAKKIEKGEKEEVKKIKKETKEEAKKIKKEAKGAAKKIKKESYYVHISRVIDVASNFDTYLLYDVDLYNRFPEDKVIKAKEINKNDSICKVIESDLNENGAICEMIKTDPSENGTDKSEQAQDDMHKSSQTDKKTAAVFIYSRHGKESYEKTKEARTKYKDVYDLGSVCGEMRELEVVAHQLYYFKKYNCLKLP